MSQHGEHKEPETKGAIWNPAISHLTIYTCAFYHVQPRVNTPDVRTERAWDDDEETKTKS